MKRSQIARENASEAKHGAPRLIHHVYAFALRRRSPPRDIAVMLGGFCHSFIWLVAIGAVMGAIERLRPANPAQRFVRSGFVTDLIYWLAPYFLYGPLAPAALAHAATTLTGSHALGFAFVARQPFWAQTVEAFLLADFLSYGGHRLLHGRTLWGFHAIHHSETELDWLATARNHPVNVVIQRFAMTAPLLWLGFPVATILTLAPVCALYNLFVHANLDWRFGALGRVFVSPAMHRWHHEPGPGCDSNFGEALAIWDVLFGTFYLPEGLPARLGLDDGPPEDVVGQTLWPLHYFLAPALEPARDG